MTTRMLRNRLLGSTMIAGAVILLGSAANAQNTAGAGAAANVAPIAPATPGNVASNGEGDTIVVTGSRIPHPNLTGASPVTVVNAAEVKFEGAVRAEDLLNQLPSVFADQGSSLSNGATGTATVNLRGLGAIRTLVLVNGRRLGPGDPNIGANAPDINFIPTSLIKSVDVLTGGAGSVYGSDAVAGVVNFKLDTDFTGVRFDVQYSLFQHGNNSNAGNFRDALKARDFPVDSGMTVDGPAYQMTMVVGAGTKDDRGHVTAYFGYQSQDALTQGDRDFSSCSLGQASKGTSYRCGGSQTSGTGNIITGGTGDQYTVQGNQFVPGNNPFNYAPYNYFQRPDERFTAGAFAHYDVTDYFKPYMEFMFMDDRTRAQIAPSGIFSGQVTTLNCDNPLLSAQQVNAVCGDPNNLVGYRAPGTNNATDLGAPATVFNDGPNGATYNRANLALLARRNVEGGPRISDLRHTDYRVVIGTKGDIAKGISYDLYGQFSNIIFQENYLNEFSIVRGVRATDVVANPTLNGVPGVAAGTPVCRSLLNGQDPNCVPYNLFQTGGITPAAVNYLQVPGFIAGNTKETVVSGSVTVLGSEYGLKSPLSGEGVGLNIGGEYRREALEVRPDLEFQTGDLAGQGTAVLPVAGSYTVGEFFAELRVPLIEDRPFAKELSIGGGYRYSDYSIQGKADSYKGEATWSPFKGLRIRGSYNRAVRAPNIQELFAPNKVALDGVTDPCSGTTPTFSQAQCSLQGVPTNRYGKIPANSANQYNGFIGGNTALTPEKADTVTVGLVIQPAYVPRLSITVDAFDIRINNVVSSYGADNILNQCGTTGNPTFCSLIHRDNRGSLWLSNNGFVVDTNVNAGRIATRGLDVDLAYSIPTTTYGTVGLSFIGTYLDRLQTTNFQSPLYDCAGRFGPICSSGTTSGTPNPRWRSKARATWAVPGGFTFSTQWRYVDPVKVDAGSKNPALTGPYYPISARIKAYSYFDLNATFRVNDKASLRMGVNNVTDKDPPIVVSQYLPQITGSGNTFPQVYDYAGRYIFVGLGIDF